MRVDDEFESFKETGTGMAILQYLQMAITLIDCHPSRKGISEVEFRQMFAKWFLARLIKPEDLRIGK
jgi:hypothetical protein